MQAPAQYDPRIAALAVYLQTGRFLPEDRLAELFRNLFHVRISAATLAGMVRQAAQRWRAPTEHLRDWLVLEAEVKHLDDMEFLDDSQGRATGFEQNLREQTLTFEVQPVKDDPRFLTRLEWHRDWSDIPFFSCTRRRACAENGLATSQTTFTAGFMWVLGPK